MSLNEVMDLRGYLQRLLHGDDDSDLLGVVQAMLLGKVEELCAPDMVRPVIVPVEQQRALVVGGGSSGTQACPRLLSSQRRGGPPRRLAGGGTYSMTQGGPR